MKFINNYAVLRKINNDYQPTFLFIFLTQFIILSANGSFNIKKPAKRTLFHSIKYHFITH